MLRRSLCVLLALQVSGCMPAVRRPVPPGPACDVELYTDLRSREPADLAVTERELLREQEVACAAAPRQAPEEAEGPRLQQTLMAIAVLGIVFALFISLSLLDDSFPKQAPRPFPVSR